MSVLELLIDVMGPVVVIVAIGWLAGSRMEFDIQTLSRLAFWVLGAAFVLDVFAHADLDGTVVVRLMVAAWGSMAAGGLLAFVLARRSKIGSNRISAAVMTSTYGNVGNAGLAISVFAFGDSAIAIAAVMMIVVMITGTGLAVALGSAQDQGYRAAVRRAALAPISVAALVALVMNVADLEFPLVLDRSISTLGAALIPVMLLTLGMQLAGDIRPQFDLDLSIVAAAKLVAVPAIAALIGVVLGLEGDVLGVLVIQSSMPPAVFCAVVALEYDLEPERVTRVVLGATLLSLLTIPVALVAVT